MCNDGCMYVCVGRLAVSPNWSQSSLTYRIELSQLRRVMQWVFRRCSCYSQVYGVLILMCESLRLVSSYNTDSILNIVYV